MTMCNLTLSNVNVSFPLGSACVTPAPSCFNNCVSIDDPFQRPLSDLPDYLLKEAAMVSGLGGGCVIDDQGIIIPYKPSLVNRVYNCAIDYFLNAIGHVYPPLGRKLDPDSDLGQNSAENASSLLKDARQVAPIFIKGCEGISEGCGASLLWGDGKAVKGAQSLVDKIREDVNKGGGITYKQATKKIGDAVRGTIAVASKEQVQCVAMAVNQWVVMQGGKVTWKNVLEERRENGYIGIHAKILLPYKTHKLEERQILCELQIHLHAIVEGSRNSTKERMHVLYKNNFVKIPQCLFATNSSSKLSFLTGLASSGRSFKTPKFLLARCRQSHIESPDLCKDSNYLYSGICDGNLGFSRSEMPQLRGRAKCDFLLEKQRQGFTIKSLAIPASQATPSQGEISRAAVEGLLDNHPTNCYNPCERPIIVTSKDNKGRRFVIEGHHRYAACRLIGGILQVIEVEGNVTGLLKELGDFPGAEKCNLDEAFTRKHQKNPPAQKSGWCTML